MSTIPNISKLTLGPLLTNTKGSKQIQISSDGSPLVWTPSEYLEVPFEPNFSDPQASRVSICFAPTPEIESFQKSMGEMGYKFQFVTLAGFHAQNYAIFDLAKNYKKSGMAAYSKLQQQEFESEKDGYTATKHQREVGTSYFDAVSNTISSGKSSTTAMEGSTESEQFN